MLKKLVFVVIVLAALLTSGYWGVKGWLKSLIPDKAHFTALKQTQTADLPYVIQDIPSHRGKILAVLTSVDVMAQNKPTGYEHTELARAYWVFVANGFEVEFASPKGGKAPVVLDGEDMGAYDYAFLNDKQIQARLANTIPLATVEPLDYAAVYFVGGKGTMFDFPDNTHAQRIAKTLYQAGRVVSAVCHGPAALVNVKLDDGSYLLDNKQVSGFTNQEELLLISDAREVFPFLLEDKLRERGASFRAGQRYLEQVSQDGKLITGQNPWSVWKMAELVVAELGYTPKIRTRTPEEHSIDVLMAYHQGGYEAALAFIDNHPQTYQQLALLMHALVAFMDFELTKGIELLKVAEHLKSRIHTAGYSALM